MNGCACVNLEGPAVPTERPPAGAWPILLTKVVCACAAADTPSRPATTSSNPAAAHSPERARVAARPQVPPDATRAGPAPARRLIARPGRRRTPETPRPASPVAGPGHADAAGAPAAGRSVSLRGRAAREGGEGLGGEPRRGHSSALGSRLSALGSRLSALGSRLSYLCSRQHPQRPSNALATPVLRALSGTRKPKPRPRSLAG